MIPSGDLRWPPRPRVHLFSAFLSHLRVASQFETSCRWRPRHIGQADRGRGDGFLRKGFLPARVLVGAGSGERSGGDGERFFLSLLFLVERGGESDGLRDRLRYERFLGRVKREVLGVSCTTAFRLLGGFV